MVKAFSVEDKYVIKKDNKFYTKHKFFDEDISKAQFYTVSGAKTARGFHQEDWEIVKVRVTFEELE
ncbi:hypothetical protein [Heyndrickxia camelliae]|uniref:Uncharacterized protein n=1 Tax=Heyndrickxia camelliae TaxID=1707093 RepID=A0A2N3LG41_9BACI|nr:hypothetical protein [Heyndrickxia camelliae]PKR83535.1 hypothetical protein CWO92_18390 [Heyndrickxia camelliae]